MANKMKTSSSEGIKPRGPISPLTHTLMNFIKHYHPEIGAYRDNASSFRNLGAYALSQIRTIPLEYIEHLKFALAVTALLEIEQHDLEALGMYLHLIPNMVLLGSIPIEKRPDIPIWERLIKETNNGNVMITYHRDARQYRVNILGNSMYAGHAIPLARLGITKKDFCEVNQ